MHVIYGSTGGPARRDGKIVPDVYTHRFMQTQRETLIIYLKTTLSMLFFGMSFISTKIVLATIGPLTLIFIRLLIASLLLYLVDRFVVRSQRVHFKEVKYFIPVAFFQPFLYFLFENLGLTMVAASIAAIMVGAIPVVTPLLAKIFLKENLPLIGIIGLIVSCIGVTMIVVDPRSAMDFTTLGLVLMGAAVVAQAAYAVVIRKMPPKFSSLTIVRMQNLIGTVMFLPVVLIFREQSTGPLEAAVIGHVLYLAVFPSTVAFLFLSDAIRKIGASRAHVFTNLVPLIAAFLAWVILGDYLGWLKIAGMIVVIGGVLLAQKREHIIHT